MIYNAPKFSTVYVLVKWQVISLQWNNFQNSYEQKYSRLRCLLRVKGLVNCFYLGRRSGSILQFRQNIIKVGSKSWLLTCSSNITLILHSYTGSAMKRELNFCNSYLSLLYFWSSIIICNSLWSPKYIWWYLSESLFTSKGF